MKNLSSQELLTRTKNLVSEERQATLALIESLAEIQRRRLFAELGFASMCEFATRELGLSEGAAQRRLQAARLLMDVPEAKVRLESGSLSLSNAAKLQSFRQAERKRGRKPEGLKLLESVESLSQRQCEAKLLELSPQALPRERERIASADSERELRIVVSRELYDKLQRIQGLIAHAKPSASYAELIEYLADTQLERLERQRGIRGTEGVSPIEVTSTGEAAAAAVNTSAARTAAAIVAPQPSPALPAGRRVYLPVKLRKAVWARSTGRCEVEAQGRRCTSRHYLQIDHIRPLALGGTNALANLRLACRQHNLQQARRKLGPSFLGIDLIHAIEAPHSQKQRSSG